MSQPVEYTFDLANDNLARASIVDVENYFYDITNFKSFFRFNSALSDSNLFSTPFRAKPNVDTIFLEDWANNNYRTDVDKDVEGKDSRELDANEVEIMMAF